MLGYFFLRIVVELFRWVPFGLLYPLSNGLAFFLYRIIGYRKKVVWDNLSRAFPEKNRVELERIIKLTYRNLTDVTLETIKSQTTSLEEIRRRCQVVNPEIVSELMAQGQSVIVAGSHHGNWEYAGLTLPAGLFNRLVGVYKPLTNKVINEFLNKKRNRGGLVLVAMEEAVGVIRKNKTLEAWAYMLISDQSPSTRKRAHWVTFFGQETATLPGVDVLSRTFNFPVFTYQIKRIRRGFYEIEYEPLALEPGNFSEGEITLAYTKRLEDEIRSQPENWLWTHKRWKMRREE
jgi:KDO2-lipid IV(A) lauroyltransferase